MTIAYRRLLPPISLAAALAVAGCAEAPPPEAPAQPRAAAPGMPLRSAADLRAMPLESAPPPPPPVPGAKAGASPIDAEMLAIGESESQIDRMFPHVSEEKQDAPKKKASRPKSGPKDRELDAPAPMASGDSCATACRALGSMTRSADHLCQLAGERDGRCEDARARVRGATSRVKSACPACSASP